MDETKRPNEMPIPALDDAPATDPGEDVVRLVASGWADALLDAIDAGPSWDREAYREASLLLGEEITWDGGSGQAVDIAPDGALVVQQGTERVELRSGAVRLVRRATLPPDDDTGAAG